MEYGARHEAAGLAPIGAEAPIAEAEPADVLVGIAPTCEIPIEQRGEAAFVGEIIAGAKIAVAEDRRCRRRRMAKKPAHAPFGHGMRFTMGFEKARERTQPRGCRIGRRRAETGESVARGPQLVQLCQLLRETLSQRLARAAELAGDDALPIGGAGHPAHDEERLADHRRIAAQKQRLRHGDAAGMDQLLHGEFRRAVAAHRERRGGVGAQDQLLPAGDGAALDRHGHQPILLHRATRQPPHLGDLDRARAGCAAQELRQSVVRRRFAERHVRRCSPHARHRRAGPRR